MPSKKTQLDWNCLKKDGFFTIQRNCHHPEKEKKRVTEKGLCIFFNYMMCFAGAV